MLMKVDFLLDMKRIGFYIIKELIANLIGMNTTHIFIRYNQRIGFSVKETINGRLNIE